MPKKIAQSLLMESEHKAGEVAADGDFILASSLTQLLFELTYGPYLLDATFHSSYSFPYPSSLLRWSSISAFLLLLSAHLHPSIPCPSIHASSSDTLHYSSSDRHCCWTASQHRTSSKGRVSVSQQINALLADWSTPAGLEPEVYFGVAQIGRWCHPDSLPLRWSCLGNCDPYI